MKKKDNFEKSTQKKPFSKLPFAVIIEIIKFHNIDLEGNLTKSDLESTLNSSPSEDMKYFPMGKIVNFKFPIKPNEMDLVEFFNKGIGEINSKSEMKLEYAKRIDEIEKEIRKNNENELFPIQVIVDAFLQQNSNRIDKIKEEVLKEGGINKGKFYKFMFMEKEVVMLLNVDGNGDLNTQVMRVMTHEMFNDDLSFLKIDFSIFDFYGYFKNDYKKKAFQIFYNFSIEKLSYLKNIPLNVLKLEIKQIFFVHCKKRIVKEHLEYFKHIKSVKELLLHRVLFSNEDLSVISSNKMIRKHLKKFLVRVSELNNKTIKCFECLENLHSLAILPFGFVEKSTCESIDVDIKMEKLKVFLFENAMPISFTFKHLKSLTKLYFDFQNFIQSHFDCVLSIKQLEVITFRQCKFKNVKNAHLLFCSFPKLEMIGFDMCEGISKHCNNVKSVCKLLGRFHFSGTRVELKSSFFDLVFGVLDYISIDDCSLKIIGLSDYLLHTEIKKEITVRIGYSCALGLTGESWGSFKEEVCKISSKIILNVPEISFPHEQTLNFLDSHSNMVSSNITEFEQNDIHVQESENENFEIFFSDIAPN